MKKAICCIAKNEEHYLDEFVQYHWAVGFDDVYVFQNDWRYEGQLKSIPETSHNKVHFIELDGKVMQLNAYNAWMQYFSPRYDWVAFIDVDEYICLRGEKSLDDILSDFCDVHALCINWRMFGDNGHENAPADGDWSLLRRFTRCESRLNKHVKQLVNLKLCRQNGWRFQMLNPHFGNISAHSLDGGLVRGPFNNAMLNFVHDVEINHYFVKTREEFAEKIARGRADTPTGRDNGDELFRTHNKNEVSNTVALDFFNNTQYKNITQLVCE